MNKSLRSAADIGPTLRLIRKHNGLTQEALSQRTGVRQATISAIENGTVQPELKTLFAILSTLNLEIVVRDRIQRSRGYAPGRGK